MRLADGAGGNGDTGHRSPGVGLSNRPQLSTAEHYMAIQSLLSPY